MLSKMAPSTTYIFSRVLLRRTVHLDTGMLHLYLLRRKVCCVYVYLVDACQISQKGILFMLIINNSDLPSLLNVLRT